MLKNITEILANQKLEVLLKDNDCCKCDKCKEDMLAYALNKLPPSYVSTDEGELFSKAKALSVDYDFDILKELVIAMNLVRGNPRH